MNQYSRQLVIGLILSAAATACDDSHDSEPSVDYSCEGDAPYANPGPFAAGVTTIQVAGVPTEIWYPANKTDVEGRLKAQYDLRQWLGTSIPINEEDAPVFVMDAYRDVPVADGLQYPIVLFSHGLGSFRTQSSFLTSHLAQWGFVVAAPDHKERGVALLVNSGVPEFGDSIKTFDDVVKYLQRAQDEEENKFFNRLNTERIMITGHSAGGSTSVDFARDPRITSYAPLSVDTSTTLPAKPSLFMAGSFDEVIPPSRTEALHERFPESSTNTYILIYGGGHNVFADICYIAEKNGGLLPLARKYNVPVPDFFDFLAEDGCRPGDLKPKEAWPMIRHYVTGLAKQTLTPQDARPSYTKEAQECFGTLIEKYRDNEN